MNVSTCDRLATVQIVTFRLRVVALVEEEYGHMQVNGSVRNSENKERRRAEKSKGRNG